MICSLTFFLFVTYSKKMCFFFCIWDEHSMSVCKQFMGKMYLYMLTITWENVLLHVNNYLRNKIYFYMLTITWENVLNAEDLIYQLHLITSEKRVLLVRLYVKQCSAVVAIFDFIQTQKHPTKYSCENNQVFFYIIICQVWLHLLKWFLRKWLIHETLPWQTQSNVETFGTGRLKILVLSLW